MTLHPGYEQTKSSSGKLNAADVGHTIEARPDCVGERAGKREGEPFIVIIGTRALDRECLGQGLRANYSNAAVSTLPVSMSCGWLGRTVPAYLPSCSASVG